MSEILKVQANIKLLITGVTNNGCQSEYYVCLAIMAVGVSLLEWTNRVCDGGHPDMSGLFNFLCACKRNHFKKLQVQTASRRDV